VTRGIYIHIPFCLAKCSYCHFISMPVSGATEDRYRTAILREIASFSESRKEHEIIDSIYFGGGTPSLIPAAHIAEVLDSCRRQLIVADDCEISLEANPGTLSPENLLFYRRSGVTRISLGVQSFNDPELSSIGRLHTSEMAARALSLLGDGGFENINIDLMLGLPGQTRETWKRNLETVARLAIPHLSVYMLDLDDPCPLQALVASGAICLPDDDLVSDLYLETIDFLSECGCTQYEISNFARAEAACRHNLKYWRREPVHGIGLGSHSFDGISRYANRSALADYFEAVEDGRSPIVWREAVSDRQALSESLFLGLRLAQGVDWKSLQVRFGRERMLEYEPGLHDLGQRGLVQWKDSNVRLTVAGMLLSNEIFQLFI
jgi:oxygen-independent coproporphyrinogen III oxidase